MSLLLIGLLGLILVLVVRGFHHHAALKRDWEFVSDQSGIDAFDNYVVKANSEEAAIACAHRNAKLTMDHAESIRILNIGLQIVQSTTGDWITLLRAVAALSRMADAVTPLSPLVPWAFNGASLSGLALLNMICHYMLVTTGERLRLRAYVLRGCWKIAMGRLEKSTVRLERGRGDWLGLDMARADLSTTRRETLRAFRAALVSCGAQSRQHPVVEPRRS